MPKTLRTLGLCTPARRLLSSALMNERERAMLMLLANGLTSREVRRARLDSLRLSQGTIKVSGRYGMRIVPLLPWTVAAVDTYLNTRRSMVSGWLFPNPRGKPMRRQTLHIMVERVFQRVFRKKTYMKPSSLAWYFAAEAVARGMPPRELAEIAGYRSLEVAWRQLAPLSPEQLVDAVARVSREPWFHIKGIRARVPLIKRPVERTRTTGDTMSTVLAEEIVGREGPETPLAIGYVRRSKESDARTVSVEVQQSLIKEYIAARGWKLAEMLIDDGVSGGRRKRLVRLEKTVRRHRAQIVVCYNLDRFARDAAAQLDSLRDYHRRGVALYVTGRGRIETETASGYLSTAVEAVVAEHYRKQISEKVKDAHARLRMSGRRGSRQPPYGFRFRPNGSDANGRQMFLVVPDPEEQARLAEIARLRNLGFSLARISSALAQAGILARNGKPFAEMTLSRLIPGALRPRLIIATTDDPNSASTSVPH